MAQEIAIVGAGLCGNLLAIMLARRGFQVSVYDRANAPTATEDTAGRSINLALAARGIRALEHAGTFAEIERLLLPMRGRIVHEPGGSERFLAYGQHSHECIWSVSRAALNRALYEIGRERWGVEYRFGHACTGFDIERMRAHFDSSAGAITIEAKLLLAADGAGSTIRRSLAAAGLTAVEEHLLDHGYKELVIPAGADGGFALQADGLHIWPRGGFMLIALPNLDRSFTATLFLPHRGQPGFDSVTAATVSEFFALHFGDVLPRLPELAREFAARPIGTLGTVHCAPWSHVDSDGTGRSVLLIGDAAHAIVPFHGQGMNAAFEDCVELDQLIEAIGPTWAAVIPRFELARRDNARAIAAMALENYQEMRDAVRDPLFERRAALAFKLERRFNGRFIPRYSMVMFHPEIGYAEAERRGRVQSGILDEAMRLTDDAAGFELAAQLVAERL
jgi:kynurenine 3-monooxygenase